MKKIFYLFLGFTLFVSCKPKSYIITSKEDAIKKGIYKEPEVIIQPTKVIVEEIKEVPKVEPKKKRKHKASPPSFFILFFKHHRQVTPKAGG